MTRRQRLSLALLMPVTLVLVGVLGAGLAQPAPTSPSITAPPQVNLRRIISDTQTLFSIAPQRVVGSAGNTTAREWIIQQFEAMSLTVETQPLTVTIASQEQTGINVWAISAGTSNDIVLVNAHYDMVAYDAYANRSAPYEVDGIATLLELARVFSREAHHRTFLFLASDSAAYGPSWGVRKFLEQYEGRARIVAAFDLEGSLFHPQASTLVLNFHASGNAYPPLWFRTLRPLEKDTQLTASIHEQGMTGLVYEQWGLDEFFSRALPAYGGDAGVFLQAGIPTIHVDSGSALNSHILEAWLRQTDSLDSIPADSVNAPYWRINEDYYLPNWATPFLQILLFAPLFVFTTIAYRKDRPREEELRPEFTTFIAWAVVGLDGYAIAFSLVAARLLPQYELFPAAPGDSFLMNPSKSLQWDAIVIYGTMAVMIWYTFRGWRGSGGWGRFADMLTIPHRQTTLLILLSGFVILTWFVNGFTAVVVFGLPAYLWPWIEPRRTLPGKLLNTALAFTGLLPLLFGLDLAFGDPAFGPWWWFFPMGAAYGFFPLLTVLGSIGFSALFIRFLRHGWREG